MTSLKLLRLPVFSLVFAVAGVNSPQLAFSQDAAVNAPAARKIVKEVRIVFKGSA